MKSYLENEACQNIIAELKCADMGESHELGLAFLTNVCELQDSYKPEMRFIERVNGLKLDPSESLVMAILISRTSARLLEMVLAAIRKLDGGTRDQALKVADSLNEDNRIVVLSVLGAANEDWERLQVFSEKKPTSQVVYFFNRHPLGGTRVSSTAFDRYSVILPVPRPRNGKFFARAISL
jgi:hypothetical protein